MHKYWVQFQVLQDGKGGAGVMEVSRELPITGERSVVEVANAIKETLIKHASLPTTAAVTIMSWCKFEEESILIASSLPPSGQSPQISLSH